MTQAEIYMYSELEAWKQSPERERLRHAQELYVWPYVLDYFNNYTREDRIKMAASPNKYPEWRKWIDIKKRYPQEWSEAEAIIKSPQWDKWINLEIRLQEWKSQTGADKNEIADINCYTTKNFFHLSTYILEQRLKQWGAICMLAMLMGVVLFMNYIFIKVDDTFLMCFLILLWNNLMVNLGIAAYKQLPDDSVFKEPLAVCGGVSIVFAALIALCGILCVIGFVWYVACGGFLVFHAESFGESFFWIIFSGALLLYFVVAIIDIFELNK